MLNSREENGAEVMSGLMQRIRATDTADAFSIYNFVTKIQLIAVFVYGIKEGVGLQKEP